MTREERQYKDHAFAFLDFFNRKYMRLLRADGTVKGYVKKDQYAKRYTEAQVYREFIKQFIPYR